ncbi:hypothetical protein OG897_40465 [Streptomyces sp. NBC_00237]|uniref:hypothetical protein n=1 Tax=Streptomyces sp. NBC_00237 TaxID=2975687 RepID=UPI0022587ACA|nr:hypothetical protein [Streptomyces sp. NBC_00237]MCX5207662.1 hypothetical protein [Streptomyces sp. NBC_00237]
MPLAPYRRIWISLWVQAPVEDGPALAQALAAVLAPHGEVQVTSNGPYWRTPEMLEFSVLLTPVLSTTDCLHSLGCTQDVDGMWQDWERPHHKGAVFLHPAVYGAQMGEEEAATAPAFQRGDIVVIRDCADARAEDLVASEAVVHYPSYDSGQPDPLLRNWFYQVMPRGRDRLEPFDEHDLQPTGRCIPADEEAPVHLSVSTKGVITDLSTA